MFFVVFFVFLFSSDFSREAILEWVQLADFYQWPHIQLFESWDDLLRRLTTTDLASISRSMSLHNAKDEIFIRDSWTSILTTVTKGANVRKSASIESHSRLRTTELTEVSGLDAVIASKSTLPVDLNEQLLSQYGITLTPGCSSESQIHSNE